MLHRVWAGRGRGVSRLYSMVSRPRESRLISQSLRSLILLDCRRQPYPWYIRLVTRRYHFMLDLKEWVADRVALRVG